MTNRKIRWYKRSEDSPERHHYNFLIINQPREITGIKQKLYDQLQPIIEEREIEQGVVEGLHFKLFTLETITSQIDFSRIYQGDVKWDRRLQPRKSGSGWNDFIDLIASGKI